MQATGINGVFRERGKIFTENLDCCKDKSYRSWNPYRSKMAAAILKGLKNIDIKSDSHVLYLGAATGTTVSHISDIAKDGVVYAVENSPIAAKKLLELSAKRHNVMPIFSDANHPDRYSSIVSSVDMIYQDISQRNQAEIFVNNVDKYLNKTKNGILMVKARSIDVSLKPKQAYEIVSDELKKHGLKIMNLIDLSPYEKDHAAITISV